MGCATADVNLVTHELQGNHLVVARFELALTSQSQSIPAAIATAYQGEIDSAN
jgi:hypothetical protein